MNWENQRVALLYGGDGSESSVSREGARTIDNAMRSLGIDPILIDVQSDWIHALLSHEPTHVFNLVHGHLGEDGLLGGVLCALNIPYTGSGVGASALAFDKPKSKQIWESLGLPTAPMVVVDAIDQAEICIKRLGSDLFVKPSREGSSVGAHRVQGLQALTTALHDSLQYDPRALVEPCLPGPEYTVGIVRGLALPVIGIQPASGFYDYTAKYQTDTTEYAIPSGLSPELEAEAQQLALEAFDALGCRSWGRVDLMLDAHGDLQLVECNTVPGMGAHSLIPKGVAAAGMDLPMVIEQLILDAEVSP